MAINRSSISSQSITENYDVAINMSAIPVDQSTAEIYLDPPVTPNILHGFYNSATGTVQLFVTDPQGRRYVPIR